MIVTEIDTTIDRPSHEVFDLISDFAQNPTWQGGMRSCVWTTDPPLRTGSRYQQTAAFLGRPILSTFEVIDYEVNERVSATTIESTFPISFSRWVTPLGPTSTRVQARIEGDSSGFFRLLEPFMAPMVRRSIRKDYERLKALLEAERTDEGAGGLSHR